MEEQGAKQKTADANIASLKVVKEQKRTDEKNIFKVLKRYDFYISQANSKASFLIGITGVVLIALITQRNSILQITEYSPAPWLNNALLILLGFGLFVSLFFSLTVVMPITYCGKVHGEYVSFIAYSSVAKMSYDAFQAHHSSENYDFWSDLLTQTHIVAKILNKKFLQLKIAVLSILLSIILFGILFFIIMAAK